MLTNLEVVSLKTVLVRDNKFIDGIRYVNQFIGRGGSNTSNMDGKEGVHFWSLDSLAGTPIRYFDYRESLPGDPSYIAVAAIVEDVVYLINLSYAKYSGRRQTYYSVTRMYLGTCLQDSQEGISYDTDWNFELAPQSSVPDWRERYVRPEVPESEE